MRSGVFIIVCCFISTLLRAQSLPVGLPVLEDVYRREQLLRKGDSSVSLTIRPIAVDRYLLRYQVPVSDTSSKRSLFKLKSELTWDGENGYLQLLPFSLQHQSNSKLPYDWNDGALIPARGMQTFVSFGAYLKHGPLSVQIRPEFVHAQNEDFTGFPTDQFDVIWAKYYTNYYNVTDIPERFGEEKYSKVLWGQSSIRLTFDPVSIGLSTENLWWGPGIRSSLLMSNTAPGFKHITLNTTRPVNTAIGSFEAQLIAGRLENSGLLPPEINRVYNGQRLYIPKRDDWRYLSGFIITYQPKWVPGLFVGASSVAQMYRQDAGKSIADFLPLLRPFESKTAQAGREYLSSLFFRWLWPEAKAEIYGEYGHNRRLSVKEFFYSPDQNAAYLLGLRKMISLNRADQHILASLEFTELQQTSSPKFGGWYTSSLIRQGYTHQGQVIGAGIGPGSTLQSLEVSWVKGLKRIGLQVEKYAHNNDFYYQMFIDPPDFRKHWIDISGSVRAEWDYRNLILSAKASMVRSLNYQYVHYNRPDEYFFPGWDILNYQVKFGLTYRF